MDKRTIVMVGLLLGSPWIAGCASAPSPVAPITPPPPMAETPPPAPSDQYVWIPGHWLFQLGRNEQYGGGYIWVRGHWGMPPHPGDVWVPDKWSPGRSTPDVPGHWERGN